MHTNVYLYQRPHSQSALRGSEGNTEPLSFNSIQFIYKEPNHKTRHFKALYKQVDVMNSNKPS